MARPARRLTRSTQAARQVFEFIRGDSYRCCPARGTLVPPSLTPHARVMTIAQSLYQEHDLHHVDGEPPAATDELVAVLLSGTIPMNVLRIYLTTSALSYNLGVAFLSLGCCSAREKRGVHDEKVVYCTRVAAGPLTALGTRTQRTAS
jgi:hypothetical protein